MNMELWLKTNELFKIAFGVDMLPRIYKWLEVTMLQDCFDVDRRRFNTLTPPIEFAQSIRERFAVRYTKEEVGWMMNHIIKENTGAVHV